MPMKERDLALFEVKCIEKFLNLVGEDQFSGKR